MPDNTAISCRIPDIRPDNTELPDIRTNPNTDPPTLKKTLMDSFFNLSQTNIFPWFEMNCEGLLMLSERMGRAFLVTKTIRRWSGLKTKSLLWADEDDLGRASTRTTTLEQHNHHALLPSCLHFRCDKRANSFKNNVQFYLHYTKVRTSFISVSIVCMKARKSFQLHCHNGKFEQSCKYFI